MVKLFFYGERQEIDQIPESFYEFKSYAGALYNLDEVDKLTFEYTSDDKNYFILNEESFEKFFLGGTKDTKVNIYSTFEETNYFQNKNKEDEKIVEKKNFKIEDETEEKIEENEKEENINNNNNTGEIDNGSNEIKLPEITKDMVIASIVKQVKSNMQRSRLMLEQKRKKEEEENRAVKEQINNLITDRLNNLKNELISESQLKYSQILSESQINLKNMYEKISDDGQKKAKIHSLEEHPSVICSGCGMTPIVGNRYSCVYCNNVNYCEKCEEQNGLSHGHPLYKFKLRV